MKSNMKRNLLLLLVVAAVVVAAIVTIQNTKPDTYSETQRSEIVVNEAARTLLYLPTYHAKRMGYFDDEGLDVEIVTGGSAATAVAALISGDAQVAIADPMYAPISRANGSDIVVAGQIVGRVGLWALTRPESDVQFNCDALQDATIITHPKPMSSFTYTELYLRENCGLTEEDGSFLEAKPGTELATYAAEQQAQFIVAAEPVVSILIDEGATIAYSWPTEEGDTVFSGILVKQSALNQNPAIYERLIRAYQRALNDIANENPAVIETARQYFPNLEPDELQSAILRLSSQEVFPRSVQISKQSWDNAVKARRAVGDLPNEAPYSDNVARQIAIEAVSELPSDD